MSPPFPPSCSLSQPLLDAIGALVVIYDADGRITSCNRHTEDLTGYSREELMGQTAEDSLLVETAAGNDRCYRTNPTSHWRCRDGSIRIIHWVYHDIIDRDSGAHLTIATGTDITEQRLGEQQIMQHAEQQEILNNLLHIGMESSSLQDKMQAAMQCISGCHGFGEAVQLALLQTPQDGDAVLLAHHRLSPAILSRCQRAAYRNALCQPAVETGHIQFVNEQQPQPEVGRQHPYYSIPVKSGTQVLAVMLLFLEAGHQQDLCEIVKLHTLANTLASIINRHQAEHELQLSRHRLLEAQRIARMGSWEWDDNRQRLRCSAMCRSLLGLGEDEDISHQQCLQSLHHDDREPLLTAIKHSLQTRQPLHMQIRMHGHEGELMHLVLHAECREDDPREPHATTSPLLVGTVQDISEQLKMQQQQQWVDSVFEGAQESIMVLDASHKIVRVNPACCNITGYTREELTGLYIDILHADRHEPLFYTEMWSQVASQGGWYGEVWSRHKNGDIYPEWRTISTVSNPDGDVENYLLISMDLSALRQSEQRIHQLVYYDSLTQLPNRSMFKTVLTQAIEDAHENKRQLAVLSLGLDGLKRINDSLGHSNGDTLLTCLAERLRQQVRDIDTVARWGGDEFTILLADVKCRENAVRVASNILNSMLEPVRLADKHNIVAGTSIGISLYPADGCETMTLIQNADVAMHQAKAAGGNRYEVYREAMNLAVIERLGIETGLRNALEQDQFELVYQAQLQLDGRRITGAEALLRWQHPRKGTITPDQFIAIAEESGLIIPIGKWVLQQACNQCVAWQQQGLDDIIISVNLSARQFRDNDLIGSVEQALQQSGLEARRLTLEITESSIMENAAQTIDTLKALKQLGVNLSIDDFGTGYSSLAYLKRFPIDKLKIDRSFVHEVDSNADDRAIVQSIIAMGHSLNLGIVAEGVEKMEHLQFLNAQHCAEAQGYLISKPVAADNFADFVKQWRKDAAPNVHRL